MINFDQQQEIDNDDMNVELDDNDIRDNLEESTKPIEQEGNDIIQIQKIQTKINTMNDDDYFEEQDEDDEQYDQNLITNKDWKRYYGNYIPFIIINDEPIFAITNKWILNLIIFSAIIYGNYIQLKTQQSNGYLIITMVLCVLQPLGYLICSLLNPGIYTAQYQLNVRNISCDICNVVHYNHDSYHCEHCEVCIREYHHHSQLFAKCIGQGNIFYYYLTLIILPMYLINLLALLLF